MSRIKVFASNWKMNKTYSEAKSFIEKIKDNITEENDYETIIFAPNIYLTKLETGNIKLGCQNMHYLEQGAYTGEISAPMLKDLNINHILIGHSERREYFNDKDGEINLKIKQALKYKLIPTVCIGEDLKTNEAGKTKQHLEKQLKIALIDVKAEDVSKIKIAYEPIWAIGTGRNALPSEINEVALFIRNKIKELYSQKESSQIQILYGGSVKPSNIYDILNEPEIDGVLVGGASLEVDKFIALNKAFKGIN